MFTVISDEDKLNLRNDIINTNCYSEAVKRAIDDGRTADAYKLMRLHDNAGKRVNAILGKTIFLYEDYGTING
jgi:hypothetical protein